MIDAPPGLEGFNHEIQGTEGFVMPSTQHDALVWLSGSAYDIVFDMARSVIRDLADQASVGEETEHPESIAVKNCSQAGRELCETPAFIGPGGGSSSVGCA
jgi:hypothetical protein